MKIFSPGYGPSAITIDSPAPRLKLPPEGETLTPDAEADQVVDPSMAEPPLVMVNST
jgi:hypothetical protein